MEREQLMDEWARMVAQGKDVPPEVDSPGCVRSTLSSPQPDLERERLAFEIRKWDEEREERRRREEREETMYEPEREQDERRQEREEKKRREEKEEERRKREAEERERREEKEAEQRKREAEERQREHKLKEEQLALEKERLKQSEYVRLANEEERNTRRSLASRIKFFNDALKGMMGTFPSDAGDIPSYFDQTERLFTQVQVDDDVRANLLLSNLPDRTKALTYRLSPEQMCNYNALKEFLLKEHCISSVQLRQRFLTAHKAADETYVALASRISNSLRYYVKSRGIDNDFNALINLLCANRLKETLPRDCLNFILGQEQDGWLRLDELAGSADTYIANRPVGGDPARIGDPSMHREGNFSRSNQQIGHGIAQKTETLGGGNKEDKSSKEEAMRKGLCFLCFYPGTEPNFVRRIKVLTTIRHHLE